VEVIALVGLAHGTSHFFHLLIPSLFPWLMREFRLSFTEAGSLTTVFFVASGLGQAAAGFVVDRVGARRVLFTGLALLAAAAALLGAARGYVALAGAALLAGLGNSVFHPSDFTILNRRVSLARLGHAFSMHALLGNVGWAAAPVFVTGIALWAGWRAASFAAGAVALAALGTLLARREALAYPELDAACEPAPGRSRARASVLGFARESAVWMCFLFFLVLAMAFGALQNFSPTVLQRVYGLSLPAAAASLTFFLLGGAAGILAGGVLAARSEAHERLVAVALLAAALVAVAVASGAIPGWSVAPFMSAIGFCTGFASPSRDLLVRKAALSRFGQGSFGRVYGFVYSGSDVGTAIAPLVFGRLMDRGMFGAVLGGVALLQGLAILAALRVGQERPRSIAGPVPAAGGAVAPRDQV
jgi:MFS transporter, FSR family, fosmidomycin resistance protein